jgi:RecA-family ATPase
VDIQSFEELVLWNYQPPPDIIGGGILVEQTGLIIFGHPKTFKSLLSQQLALCLTNATPWLNFPTAARRVLYVQAEIPKTSFRNRVIKMGGNLAGIPSGSALFATTFITKLDRDQGRKDLISAVIKFQPQVTILDPMYRFISSSDENAIIRFLDAADELKSTYGQTVVIVHHARKARVNTVGQILDSGGGELRGPLVEQWADSIIRVQGDINTDVRSLSFELRNAPQLIPPFNISLDRNRLWFSRI